MFEEDIDWKEKYFQQNNELKSLERKYEDALQDNHGLKRDLTATQETNRYLNEELESCEARYLATIEKTNSQWSEKVESMKKQNQDLKEANHEIESRVNRLSQKIAMLESEERNPKPDNSNDKAPNVSLEDSCHLEEIAKYKDCIGVLECELVEVQSRVKTLTQELEEVKERCEYLDSNLTAKREEIVEKTELVDALQQQNMELTLEINNLRTSAEHGQKGNSLFAEVDDQRQKFRQRLEEQNQQFSQMKKIYKDSQNEIHRLKLENQDILSSMESCKRLFENGSALKLESLKEQIDALEIENDKLNELIRKYEKIISESGPKDFNILLEHERSQIKNYKAKYFNCLQQKSSLEENLAQCQQQSAQFQLEILELRTKLRAEKSLREKLEKKSPEVAEGKEKPKPVHWREIAKQEEKKNAVTPMYIPPPSFPIKIKQEVAGEVKQETNKENVTTQLNYSTPVCRPNNYRDINVRPIDQSEPVKEKAKEVTEKVAINPPKFKSGFTVKTIKITNKKPPMATSSKN